MVQRENTLDSWNWEVERIERWLEPSNIPDGWEVPEHAVSLGKLEVSQFDWFSDERKSEFKRPNSKARDHKQRHRIEEWLGSKEARS